MRRCGVPPLLCVYHEKSPHTCRTVIKAAASMFLPPPGIKMPLPLPAFAPSPFFRPTSSWTLTQSRSRCWIWVLRLPWPMDASTRLTTSPQDMLPPASADDDGCHPYAELLRMNAAGDPCCIDDQISSPPSKNTMADRTAIKYPVHEVKAGKIARRLTCCCPSGRGGAIAVVQVEGN